MVSPKLFTHKKAFAMSVIYIALALASFIILAVFLTDTLENSGKVTQGTSCKTQLGIQELTKQSNINKLTIKNQCTTFTETIKAGPGDEVEVMKLLADKIARTWWIIHEGKYGEDLWNKQSFWGSEGCVIMYSIDIDEKGLFTKKGVDIPREDMALFMASTIYPPKQDKQLTYMDYVFEGGHSSGYMDILPQNYAQGNNQKKSLPADDTNIQSGKTYAITVWSDDKSSWLARETFKNYFRSTAVITGGAPLLLLVESKTKDITDSLFDREDYAGPSPDQYIQKYVADNAQLPPTRIYFTTMDYAEKKMGCEYR